MRDMVVFGEDWGQHPSSTQHLVRQFLKERRVIWVDSLGLRTPRLTISDAGRLCQKAGSILRRALAAPARSAHDGIKPHRTIAPLAIPAPNNRFANAVNRQLVSRQINKAMQELGMQRPVLWTSLPTAQPLIGAFDHGPVVYYAGDDFSALAGVDHDNVVRAEQLVAAAADLVFAASPNIALRFPAEKTAVLRHGVDLELFSTQAPRPADLPKSRPIIGFYGSLSAWIDIDLLWHLARSRPDYDVVLIGKERVDISKLRKLPNVHILGPRPHSSLPGYVQHFDVAILPFLMNDQIMACDPLKLREYLASGTPIATKDFPALDLYRPFVHVGNTTEQFLWAIDRAMQDKGRSALRRGVVSGETWQRRADDAMMLLDLIEADSTKAF